MKKTLLASAVGLTFLGASAQISFAQSYSPEGNGNSPQYGQQTGQASPTGDEDGWLERWRHEQSGRDSESGQNESAEHGPRSGAGGGSAPPPHPHHPPPPPAANAAHFVFQRGSARIDITCPQVFALNDCIQAAMELFDKIHSLRAGAQNSGAGTPHPGVANAPSGGAEPPSGTASGDAKARQSAPSGGIVPQIVRPTPGDNGRM
jgi:hypothetical protein